MNKFKFSFFYIIILVLLNPFHAEMERFIHQNSIERFVFYFLIAVFFSFFIMVLWRVIKARKDTEMAMVVLIIGVVFFFLTSMPRIGFRICIFEFFLLGVLLAVESHRKKLWAPLFLLLFSAVLAEVASHIVVSQGIFYNDIWRYVLFGLCGFVSMAVFKKA